MATQSPPDPLVLKLEYLSRELIENVEATPEVAMDRPLPNAMDLLASMAKPTVMGGQQVCNQACRPCNDCQ